jgi:hypothetical protein
MVRALKLGLLVLALVVLGGATSRAPVARAQAPGPDPAPPAEAPVPVPAPEPGDGPGQPADAVDPEFHGVNAQGVFSLPADRWDAQLATIAGLGLRVVRRDAFWSDAEPRPPLWGVHLWRWTRHDAVAEALARHGLRWYPILDYGTPWATSTTGPRAWMAPPDDPATFAAYAQAFAERYGRGGAFWREHPELPDLPVTRYEVWNEENVANFWPDQGTAPEAYARLFVLAAGAVHGVDASAQVVVGGLSVVGVGEFLARMTQAEGELWPQADAVGFHPYGGDPSVTYARIATLRGALAAVGAGAKPIEVTETGWASPPRSEERRAAELARLAEELPRSDCGVTRLLVHSWLTREADPADPEDWFGIANPDGSPKPSALAFAQGAAAARASGGEPVALCAAPGR